MNGNNVPGPFDIKYGNNGTPKTHVSMWKHKISHPLDNFLTIVHIGMGSKARNMIAFSAYQLMIELKNIK